MIYKIWGWKTIRQLGNLTFAIILLLLISFISIIGTIIEQDHSVNYYKERYPVKTNLLVNLDWQTIKKLHIDQIYTSWPFLILLFIFGTSLIICTLSTQLPSLKNARRWKLKKNLYLTKPLYKQNTETIPNATSSIYFLNQLKYYVFYQNNLIYSYKGLVGKVAPIFVHISIILLLIGSLISLFYSFLIQEIVPNKEFFNLQNTVHAGYFSNIPSQIIGKINGFYIEYYKEKSVKQFYSSISLINKNSQHNIQKEISVNSPLYFEGLTIYQTDWQINGLKVKIDGQNNLQIPVIKINNEGKTYWFSNIKYNNKINYSLILSSLDGSILCYNSEGKLIHNLQVKQQNIIDYIPVQVVEVITSTGIQIKEDPGILIIYCSFGILIVSTFLSYISYSQIWITINSKQLHVTGITNRAQIKLEEDIFKIQRFLQ